MYKRKLGRRRKNKVYALKGAEDENEKWSLFIIDGIYLS